MTSQKTILIVDDESMSRDILEGFLAREGYNLAAAESGPEALAYLENHLPDIILLDIMMPGMSGFEVCQHLKTNKQWRHIPVILVTALGTKEDLARGLDAGADDFVNKPVDYLELKARIRSMLRIKEQYDELQADLRLREDLAHMIVHDMRTPLTAITGYSNLLQMKGTLSPEDTEEVEKISIQARRLNSFMNDMLLVAKMEEGGNLILHRSKVDINQLVKHAIEDQDIVTQLKRDQIVMDLPAESPWVFLDVNLFQRVLDNLISNALKFSPPQSIVTVRVENLTEKTEVFSSQPQIRIQILDQGPGIAAEDRDRIFEKFKVVPLQQRDTSQIGLGLILCKMVVEAHGGRIFVEDNKPAGSIFSIDI